MMNPCVLIRDDVLDCQSQGLVAQNVHQRLHVLDPKEALAEFVHVPKGLVQSLR